MKLVFYETYNRNVYIVAVKKDSGNEIILGIFNSTEKAQKFNLKVYKWETNKIIIGHFYIMVEAKKC